MVEGGRQLQVLDQILERYRVVQHGVSMYFGSAEPLNREHLRRLKTLVKRTNTPWLTDHLCWGSAGGECRIVRMPANFPPSGKASRELSGMGTPDLLGTYGTFSFFTSRPVPLEEKEGEGADRPRPR